MQVVFPGLLWYRPGRHAVQTVALVLSSDVCWPAAQILQTNWSLLYMLVPQDVQVDNPSVGAMELCGHFLHAVLTLVSSVYFPLGQLSQKYGSALDVL